MPKAWQEKMQCHRFNCVDEGQAKFIRSCENLESLDLQRETKGKSVIQMHHLWSRLLMDIFQRKKSQ
eukprot:7481294-Ditylum_brightwellii.AAC.1